jgi:Ca2+-binding RTX toxin-like protein
MTDITTSTETSGNTFAFSSDGQVLIIDQGVSLISDTYVTVIVGSSVNNQVVNFGNIFGADIALDAGSSSGTVFENAASGNIFGQTGMDVGGDGAVLINSGGIDCTYEGIIAEGASDAVRNSGHIFGSSYGISLGGASDSLNNCGSIASDQNGVYIFGGGVSIVNTGSIQGANAIDDASSGPTTITNHGSLHGAVFLGSGSNTLDSRHGGTVDGLINGGGSADTIYLGNDGETVNGGGGLDRIYGGAGSDTFAFSHDGATNAATIHGFNVSNDAIELSHSLFTKLAVGATPTFAISKYATSASDHLFYNTTNGSLWYDSNGNAAGGVVEIANLGPGLKLTASNFTVV